MVSSSLDKSIKKTLAKDMSATSLSMAAGSADVPMINNSSNPNSAATEEKLEILFPKCRPRVEYQTSMESSSDLISITSPSSTTQHSIINTTSHNLTQQVSNSKQMKLLSSPDHKKQQHQFSKLSAMSNNKHESNDNYVETNPFRIGSNNRFFYAQQNDSLFNNSATAAPSAATSSSGSAMMHHYHYQPSSGSYHNYQLDRNYYLEPDEIEHNPYAMDVPPMNSMPMNTIPSSILKTTPPDTPPALQPCTTPVDTSPLGSSRNLWDLSPIKIKSSTPTRIKAQSPTSHYTRPHRGSYKKLLASPIPIEEDLEMGHYYYNNKKTYYQAPQTDSDSNEPATFNEVEKIKANSLYFNNNSSNGGNKSTKSSAGNNKMKHSESSDVIYAEVRKKDERKMVKSKSGSGIMGKNKIESFILAIMLKFRIYFKAMMFCNRIN